MDYLTQYYKNLSEQLEIKLNMLKQKLMEATLNDTPTGTTTGSAGTKAKLSSTPASSRMYASGSGTITSPPADTPVPPDASAAAEEADEQPDYAPDSDEPTREDVEDTGGMPALKAEAAKKKESSDVGAKPSSSSGGAGFGSSEKGGPAQSSGAGRLSRVAKPAFPKQQKGETYEEYQSRLEDYKDQSDSYDKYLKDLAKENKERARARGQAKLDARKKAQEEQNKRDQEKRDAYKKANQERRGKIAPGNPGTIQYGPPSP